MLFNISYKRSIMSKILQILAVNQPLVLARAKHSCHRNVSNLAKALSEVPTEALSQDVRVSITYGEQKVSKPNIGRE